MTVDHGIEPPRQRGDKPKRGRLQISVEEVPGAWRVRIEDDGRGIDAEALGRAAVRAGTISFDQLQAMSEQERVSLVFGAGISTKEEVTAISGRGVGAGAVLKAVLAAGGTVAVGSVLGQGTSFQLSVPRPSGARAESLAA